LHNHVATSSKINRVFNKTIDKFVSLLYPFDCFGILGVANFEDEQYGNLVNSPAMKE
jgi:hypothetical protein